MNRRDTVFALLALGAAPSGLVAQPGKIWRVGFLVARRRPASIDADFIGAFPHGMRELGYVEGKNLAIEWRFGDADPARLPGLAAELVQAKVDVIVAVGAQSISAAQKATTTIPIVMGITGDPVSDGFVKSLAHPGGNITGTSLMMIDIMPKRLEMLQSMTHKLVHAAVLLNPGNSTSVASLTSLQAIAQKFRVKLLPAEVRTLQEIEPAFAMMARERVGAVIVIPDSLLNVQVRPVAELAVKLRLPSIAGLREYVEAGGLASYGPSYFEILRRTATYVDKIFKGAKPADLPVEQPTKFEFVINLKTAKAIGLTIPPSVLARADEVIE